MSDESDRVLITKGLTSMAYAMTPEMEPDGPKDRYGIGHVAPFDWDDHVAIGEIPDLLDDAGLGGPTVVFESSEGNLHGWNLTLREFPETAAVLEAGRDDTKHRLVGEDRGWWRLRVGPKLTADDDVYKSAPDRVTTYNRPLDTRFQAVSSPHLEWLRSLHGPLGVDGHYPTYGSHVEMVAYATFTDRGKELQRVSEVAE